MNNTLNIAHVVQRLRTLRWTRLSQLVMRRRKQRNTWPHGCARRERDCAQRTGPPGNPPPLHGHREQGPVSAQFVFHVAEILILLSVKTCELQNVTEDGIGIEAAGSRSKPTPAATWAIGGQVEEQANQ